MGVFFLINKSKKEELHYYFVIIMKKLLIMATQKKLKDKKGLHYGSLISFSIIVVISVAVVQANIQTSRFSYAAQSDTYHDDLANHITVNTHFPDQSLAFHECANYCSIRDQEFDI